MAFKKLKMYAKGKKRMTRKTALGTGLLFGEIAGATVVGGLATMNPLVTGVGLAEGVVAFGLQRKFSKKKK